MGRDVWSAPHPLSCLQQVLSESAGQAVVQLASGNLQEWKLNNVSGWPAEKKFLHSLAAVSLSIERKKAIERNFIALKCCCVRYSTFCVSVNNVKGIVVFLSLWQTNETYVLGYRSFSTSIRMHSIISKTKTKNPGNFWGLDFSFYWFYFAAETEFDTLLQSHMIAH